MKPTQEEMEDRLLDALLHEQNRSDRETALQAIDEALDRSIAEPVRPRWRKWVDLTIAASIIGGIIAFGVGEGQRSRAQAQKSNAAQAQTVREQRRAAQDKTIRDQADKEVEQRKALAKIIRSRGLIDKGQDSFDDRTNKGETLERKNSVAQSEILEKSIDKSMKNGVLRELPDTNALAGVSDEGQGLGVGHGDGGGAGNRIGSGTGTGFGRGTGFVVPEKFINDASYRNKSTSFADPSNGLPLLPPLGQQGIPEAQANDERYGSLVDPSWQQPTEHPLSTFSIDVNNASYSNIRRMIRDGQMIPKDAVRIEECINAFDYNYAKPTGDKAFAVHSTLATCPWNEDHLLMQVGIKGREIPAAQRPASNLVFLIDVSGSMQEANKLPLVKKSLRLLLHQLDERDKVSFIVYAGRQGVILPPTKLTESGRVKALEALGKLEAGGSTNGGAGILRAYQMAKENFIKNGVNRVILATDGDFNVGITNQDELVKLVKERAASNIYLSVLGFGTGNFNDSLMESISKDGNGNYYYIDSIREGRKVLLQRLSGTLITIAKDVKIQIEFNPKRVGSYRLIGYANRVLKDEDFNNDQVDAGDIGAGHTVTAFYEIVPAGRTQPGDRIDPLKYQKPIATPVPASDEPNDEWLTLKLRHKSPEGDISSLQESIVKGSPVRWQDAGPDFNFATSVALFGMKLRGMDEATSMSWKQIEALGKPGLKHDSNENRAEFMGLLELLEKRD